MRQLIDPTSAVNASRVPTGAAARSQSSTLGGRLRNLFGRPGGAASSASRAPQHYTPAYDGAPELSYSRGYAPPAGPPPADHDEDGYGEAPPYEPRNNKLPGYGVGMTGDMNASKVSDDFNIGGSKGVKGGFDADPFSDVERGSRE